MKSSRIVLLCEREKLGWLLSSVGGQLVESFDIADPAGSRQFDDPARPFV